MERLLTAEEVAVVLGLPSVDSAYRYAREKVIPSVRIGRLVRFPESKLREMVERQTAKNEGDDQEPTETNQ